MVAKTKKPAPSRDLKAKMASALADAIAFFGSQAKMAKAIGVKQPSIAGAVLRGRLSEGLAVAAHEASKGKCPKWELRPDLFKRGGK